MFRRLIAGLFLGPALLIGSFAWSGFIAGRTVFDSNRSTTIAHELLDNEEVRSQLADNLGSAVEAALPDGVSVDKAQVSGAAEAVLADPEVESLIIEAFSSTHRAFLGEGDAPRTIDLTPMAAMVRDQLVSAIPSLDASLPASQPLVVTLPTDQIPDASPVRNFLRTTVPYLAAISLIGILIALLATSDRPAVLKRAAGWAIGTTAVYLIIGLGVPELIRRFAPDQAKVVAALLAALLRSTLTPSIILAIIGGALLIGAFAWPDGDRRPATATAVPAQPRQQVQARESRSAAVRPEQWPTMPPAQQVPPPTRPPSPAPPVHLPASMPPPPAPPVQAPAPPQQPQAPAAPPQPPANPVAVPAPRAPMVPPPAHHPRPQSGVLPTRANVAEPVDLPAWTGETGAPKRLPPRWVDGHGWVLDPNDTREPPPNSRWVEGVGRVVPGPPPNN